MAKQGINSNKNSGGSAMRVIVRVRPTNEQEANGAYTTCVQPLDSRMLVFDPKNEEDQILRKAPGCRTRMLKRKPKDLRMMFDRVFDENATQMEVHESSTKLILDAVLNGYNCSIFAYGATGAGKTYTMLGSNNSPGIIFLCMMELYQRIEESKKDKSFEVAVSYIEVTYNSKSNNNSFITTLYSILSISNSISERIYGSTSDLNQHFAKSDFFLFLFFTSLHYFTFIIYSRNLYARFLLLIKSSTDLYYIPACIL